MTADSACIINTKLFYDEDKAFLNPAIVQKLRYDHGEWK